MTAAANSSAAKPRRGEFLDVAASYQRAGLAVLPASRAEKRPAVASWRKYQRALPTSIEVRRWFARAVDAICIVCGEGCGGVEVIDFDAGGELYAAWAASIPADLLAKLVIERTPSGGYHAIYRCEAGDGNMRLAQRRLDDGKVATLIETRGEGGLILCAPTQGYEVVQGELRDLPTIGVDERDTLISAAVELTEHEPPAAVAPPAARGAAGSPGNNRPGDDFSARGDVRDVLTRHGWSMTRGGENEHWCRPGKTGGTSATLRNGVFYVFSANAAPFEANRAYSPFAVYAALEHGGDFRAAATELASYGFGDQRGASPAVVAPDAPPSRPPEKPQPPERGIPDHLLRVPGFVSEVMDYCLATAPYPNHAMAFCGAIALQAFLAGRKVRDPGDNRTNVYVLGLAHSAAGKDWPRKVNVRIAHAVGLLGAIGDRFASGEGVQDALYTKPCMLFQTDEIDGMLQAVVRAKDGRYESLMGTLLTMYSSSNSIYPMRRKAGQEEPGTIDQPCLVMFGTAIPNHYYEALSERMLTNGLFARMIVIEAGPRGVGQDARLTGLPARVLATATWWRDFAPGSGGVDRWVPKAEVVEHTAEAKAVLDDARDTIDAHYASCESDSDAIGTAIWGRANETARKLALIYAVSESPESPSIGRAAATWGGELAIAVTQRMLGMAAAHVADSEMEALRLRLLDRIRLAPGREMSHSAALKAARVDARAFSEMIETLVQRGDIEVHVTKTAARPSRTYRIARDDAG